MTPILYFIVNDYIATCKELLYQEWDIILIIGCHSVILEHIMRLSDQDIYDAIDAVHDFSYHLSYIKGRVCGENNSPDHKRAIELITSIEKRLPPTMARA